jgi:hypothetical protein
MHESEFGFHNLEWPPPGARLAGPVAWLRGWIVGKGDFEFVDVRVRHAGRTHLGVLGLPRADLASHFKAAQPWLPAEFILGVPLEDGAVSLTPEVMDAHGAWHALPSIGLIVAPDGSPAPRVEGRLENYPDGTWTIRDAHHPFHGHLDEPGPAPRLHEGRAQVFGWLLDETRPLAAVLATTDTLVFNHLAHSLTDDSLPGRVNHPGAGQARLRGPVDFPATLDSPVCLRVYAISPDGAATLCFAQRVHPVTPAPLVLPVNVIYPGVPSRALPARPSARPRRLLVVTRSLLPGDTTLRALDVVRHLTSAHEWAARLVSTEDGPLRREFEQAGVESLVVNPEPLFSARDEEAMEQALANLRRQIWWKHLDAVAVFDPVCGWALTLAAQEGIPALFDCFTDEPLQPDPTAIPAVQSLLRESWRKATAVCFGSNAAAGAQHPHLADRPAEIISSWHSPQLPRPTHESRTAVMPLRPALWLMRHHPATAAQWSFRQGPDGINALERLTTQDSAFNLPGLTRTRDWSVEGVSLCLGPLFGRGALRPVIDAAAAGLPVVAPRRPFTEEIFRDTRVPLADPANPLAYAHALLAFVAVPDSFRREADAIAPVFRAQHDPARLLPQWERLLENVAATRG